MIFFCYEIYSNQREVGLGVFVLSFLYSKLW